MKGQINQDGQFLLKGSENTITASDLDMAFSELQDIVACRIILIMEANGAESFFSTLSNFNRIIITSADNDLYNMDTNAPFSFSRILFSKLRESNDLYEAFTFARDKMKEMGCPEPLLDDNADGKSDNNDGDKVRYIFPCQHNSWTDKPVIDKVNIEPSTGNFQSVQVSLEIEPGAVDIDQVIGFMILPDITSLNSDENPNFREFNLNQNNHIYSAMIHDLIPFGAYRFVFQAENIFHEFSDPEIKIIDKTKLPGDIDNNGKIQLADAILALMVTGEMSQEFISKLEITADVNNDLKIGLFEAIYVMKYLGR